MKAYFQVPTVVIAVLLMAGCDRGVDNHAHPKLTSGKQLYEHHCASCHGNAGEGNFLAGIPANRNTDIEKHQLIKWLKNLDGKERAAPSFPMMSDLEAEKIVDYLLTLN